MIKDAVRGIIALMILAFAILVITNTHYQNSIIDLAFDVLHSTPRDPFHVGEIKAWMIIILGFIIPFGAASAIALLWFRITSTRKERMQWREQDQQAREQARVQRMADVLWTHRPRRY